MNKKRDVLKRHSRISGLLAVSVCLMLAGCFGPKEPPRYLDEGEGHLVRLDRVDPAEQYDHPAEIELETIQAVLNSIVVRHEVSFLNRLLTQQKEIRGAAFTPEEATLLAERLKRALAIATPEERAAFFLTSQKNSMTTLITSGVAYVKEKEIHLIFGNDRTALSNEHRPHIPRENPLYSFEPGSFAILPQSHQRKLSGEGRRVEAIAVDFAALVAPPPEPIASEDEKPALSSEGTPLEAQLRLLKKLREEDLITEEEYKEKKSELLKTLK
ncbi:MAG: hypothetical protein MCM46_00870 [Candidatus Manganitrophus sp. SB1]|nr:hypothetical protein [Candidatus Manganitrophus morganii]